MEQSGGGQNGQERRPCGHRMAHRSLLLLSSALEPRTVCVPSSRCVNKSPGRQDCHRGSPRVWLPSVPLFEPSQCGSGHGCVPPLHLHKQNTLSWETKHFSSQIQRRILAAAGSGSGGALFLSADSAFSLCLHMEEGALLSSSSSSSFLNNFIYLFIHFWLC